ncbi:hypothetical protein [Actinosynnema sp. NPDC023587]|uniref:hypothetical protein n=1 Tax=Actinosynnema sp. NPDC023587 TaxID=3154695 RepID=UPI0033CE4A7E
MTAPTSVARTLAGATVREVTAGLYVSPDYTPGDLDRQALELVELWAVLGMEELTPGRVDQVHTHPADPARLADCRATARTVLAAQ